MILCTIWKAFQTIEIFSEGDIDMEYSEDKIGPVSKKLKSDDWYKCEIDSKEGDGNLTDKLYRKVCTKKSKS